MRGERDSRRRAHSPLNTPAKPAEPASTVRVAVRASPPASPHTPPPVSSARPTVDIILQGSTVELFHAYGVAVAPLGSSPVGNQRRYYEVVGVIGFDAVAFAGTLTLSIPTPVFQAYCDARDPAERTTLADWTQELTNQLLGRIKNRLTMFQTNMRVRLPSVMSGIALERLRKRTPDEVLYRFRSLRGDILVTLDAPLGNATLTYSGFMPAAREGDVILF